MLHLHGENTALEALECMGWRTGLNDDCSTSGVLAILVVTGWRNLSRVQAKSSTERLLLRSE